MIKQFEQARRPFHILCKPIGPLCNLDCEYCFYLKKVDLFPESKGRDFRMTDETLEAFTRQYIESQPEGTPELNFAFQGGEPTLMCLKFFQRAVELQKKYARPGLNVTNCLQTNGTLLDDDWGKFLNENNFLVGISIDGPQEMHDKFRFDKKRRPSFQKVMQGLEVLQRNKVEFNTLTVVQSDNGDHPHEIYNFLKASGSQFFQFIPIVEKNESDVSFRSVGAEQFGKFLCGIFDEWTKQNDVGKIFVRDFDAVLGALYGGHPGLCVYAETCGDAVAIEHNGNLYSCDHFVNEKDFLGNVNSKYIADMLESPQQRKFGCDKRDGLPSYCKRCQYIELCNGACPKDRIIDSPDGEPGLNFLCAGFKMFYDHAVPTFFKMVRCLYNNRPASEWKIIDQRPTRGSIPRRL